MALSNPELEQLEKEYLDQIYFSMSDAESSMISYLNSRNDISDDWWDYFFRTSKQKQTSELARGAERVFFYLACRSWRPNSAPIGSDLFFEAHNAYLHIEIKTARKSNDSDYGGEVPMGQNQTSYVPTHAYTGTKLDTQANLPQYYSQDSPDEKPCLTYAIQIIYDHQSLDTIAVSLIAIPNGQLFDIYGNDPIKAGKNKNESFRYKFSRRPKFELLENKPFRVRLLYFASGLGLSKEDVLGISNHPDI